MADTTTAIAWPASTSRFTCAATLRMRSMSATEVPPNLSTNRDKSPSKLRRAIGSPPTQQEGRPFRDRPKLRLFHTDWGPGPQWIKVFAMTPALDSSMLDRDEVARFAKLAGDWWDAKGPFKPLHRINPVRLTYIRDQLCKKFSRDPKGPLSLAGLSVLDIGCGGGLLSPPFAPPRAPGSRIRPPPANL